MITGVETLRPRLEALLGADAVAAADPGRWAVDGMTARLVARPADAEQIAATLRLCAEHRAAVIPWGSGTAMEIGNPGRAADVILLTERLSRLIDHDHANLTVTAEAGITLGALARVLAARGQHLPLEPPRAEEATAGGAAAVALSGPRRMAFGAARDLVIGMRAALADGSVIKWGGKTVKNVAGYDMCKLFVGSMGSLGMLTELTLKVFPLPEATRTIVTWARDVSAATALAARVMASPLLPTAITQVNPTAGAMLGRRMAGVLVRAEGIEAAVDRHQRDVQSWASQEGLETELLAGEREREAWQVIRDFGWRGDGGGGAGDLAVRITVTAGRIAAVVNELQAMLPAAGVVAHVTAGVIWVAFDSAAGTSALLASLRDLTRRHDGHLLLARAPRALKVAGDVWFPAPQALALMRGLKQAFDPHQILNPGRFVAGL
ncbi:MAG: FAD-binding oxidoreductase [Armatimonadetes bacterium]|nr:FAD-binding oxidoreductase [Armatimonadota bacterium]